MTLARTTAPGALAHYDPQKGVKKIAVLEMAEKHYRAAKKPEQLRDAIRKKLEAQAEFVDWWTTKGPGANHGGPGRRGNKMTDPSSCSADEVAQHLGTNVKTISRWRQRTATPEAFEKTCEAQTIRALRGIEAETMAHVGQNTGDNEWFTPAEYIEAARSVLGAIDLDPASSNEANAVVKATTFYSAENDGLEQPWTGRVWMNPPYAQPLITKFCERLSKHVQQGEVTAAVVLVNNATETGWFRSIADVADAVCFPEGRIRFWHPKKDTAAPLQGQAFLYCGPDAAQFNATFARFGVVWVKP